MRAIESAEEALSLLEREEFFMVITDARLGGMSGYEFLGKARAKWPDLPVLMITAYATPKLAVEAIKAGAIDYLAKPFAPEELLHAVARCAERYRLLQENATLRARATETWQPRTDRRRKPQDARAAPAHSNRRAHRRARAGSGRERHGQGTGGRRAAQPEPAQPRPATCASIAPPFPKRCWRASCSATRKAPSPARLKQKPGRVEEADGGTIFLDEIADMSRPLQAKLLRFLEDGTFTRVGGTQELRVNVRLIAATNRDIIEAIRQDQFREDLFHRLNVVQFRLPPLRERGDDVLLLADHFLRSFGVSLNKKTRTISRAARQKLLSHHWPGNVRELRNVIERALILETTSEIQPGSLPDFQLGGPPAQRRRRQSSPARSRSTTGWPTSSGNSSPPCWSKTTSA